MQWNKQKQERIPLSDPHPEHCFLTKHKQTGSNYQRPKEVCKKESSLFICHHCHMQW